MGESTQYELGRWESVTRTVTARDVERFAAATGDTNPVHLDEAFAGTTRFKRRIAHGMLVGSYISSLIGTDFPGPGTIYLSQTLKFTAPVYLGDTLTVRATVAGYRPDKQILTLETVVTNQNGAKVVTGEAVCLVSEVAERCGAGVSA
ncbi:MAG: MaoC family dehydratase [Candidatus Eremiobacteraeota bacterium]|nr:MaoC family dehydratase [Candidatus Eremiobacteraeota bacterium]